MEGLREKWHQVKTSSPTRVVKPTSEGVRVSEWFCGFGPAVAGGRRLTAGCFGSRKAKKSWRWFGMACLGGAIVRIKYTKTMLKHGGDGGRLLVETKHGAEMMLNFGRVDFGSHVFGLPQQLRRASPCTCIFISIRGSCRSIRAA